MKLNMLSVVAAIVVAGCLAMNSMAAEVSFVQTPNPGGNDGQNNLAGTITNDILIDTVEGESIGSQQLLINLTSGTFVHHPFGGNGPPSTGLSAAFANLPFDTYVAAGSPRSDGTGFNPGIVAASDSLGGPGGMARFTATELDATWGPALGQVTAGVNDYLSARLTFAPEADGAFRYLARFSTGGEYDTTTMYMIENGVVQLGDDGVAGIDVLGNAMLIGNGDLTPSLDDNTDFGTVFEGSIQNRVFSITNTGTADLLLDALNITGDFSLVGAFPGTLGPSATEIFTVSMDTSVLGAKSGTVSFGTNVLDVATFSFDLAGNVIPEPTSLSLLGLALIGMIGFGRRRS